MMRTLNCILAVSIMIISLACVANKAMKDIPPNQVLPTQQQIAYQKMELIGFIHFTVNTFTDLEWGLGTEDPQIFNPTELDVNQWVNIAAEAGIKQLIITAKHHDGFCLWPSKYTEHSIQNSPYQNGQGDIIKELSEACRKKGIKLGIYLSPWDRHEKTYGTDQYNKFYLNQLEELLTRYGEISEVWMDGAKGENAKDMAYDFEAYRALIRKLQPNALIFSDAGPDIRWIGNERGIAGETNWSTINTEGIIIGKADQAYLNTGDPNGIKWVVGECDVSIRPGWFYHQAEDSLVKSPQELVDLYNKSVGRNATLLINLPPDRRGLLHENDVTALKEFKRIIDETFRTNLARKGKAVSDSYFKNDRRFQAQQILDQNDDTYWAAAEGKTSGRIEIAFDEPVEFDRILLQEPIKLGQRIAEFSIEALHENRFWVIAQATTIGYKRLLKLDSPIRTKAVRIIIKNANQIPAISNFGLYRASEKELRYANTTYQLRNLPEAVKKIGKAEWQPVLQYAAQLHQRSIHPARPPFQYPFEEIGPGYHNSPAFGHWDIIHQALNVLKFEPEHARLQLLNSIQLQQQDGMLPAVVYMGVNPPRLALGATHPPVWPLAVQDYVALTGRVDFLNECYPILIKQIKWFEQNRKADDGGYFYLDMLKAHNYESGVDQGVRFDQVQPVRYSCVDATCHVFNLYQLAADWSQKLRLNGEQFSKRAAELRTFIQTKLFCEATGFFHDRWAIEVDSLRHLAFEGIWAIVTQAASPEQADRVIDENLLNPERFFSDHPIATVGLADPQFELRLWRGPAWNSMTYWACRGCLNYGRSDAAVKILKNALDATAIQFARTGAIWEFYHPLLGDQFELKRKPETRNKMPEHDYLGHNPLIAMAIMYDGLIMTK